MFCILGTEQSHLNLARKEEPGVGLMDDVVEHQVYTSDYFSM